MMLSRRKLADFAAKAIAEGRSKDEVLREVAAYLLENGRRREADLLSRDIERALGSHGIIVGTVTSARALSKASLESIDDFIKENYRGTKRIALREVIDTSVIGGMKLELPDKQLDVTTRTRLDKLTV